MPFAKVTTFDSSCRWNHLLWVAKKSWRLQKKSRSSENRLCVLLAEDPALKDPALKVTVLGVTGPLDTCHHRVVFLARSNDV